MRLTDMLVQDALCTRLEATTGEAAIAELAGRLCKALDYPHPEAMISLLSEREELGSTAVGEGVAIPHARVPDMKQISVAVGISEKGVDFRAPDKKKSHLVVMLVGPMDPSGLYLKALARVARLAKDDILRSKLSQSKSAGDVVKAVADAEARHTG